SPVLLFLLTDTATTVTYTLSLHDALPIFRRLQPVLQDRSSTAVAARRVRHDPLARRILRKDRKGAAQRRPQPGGDARPLSAPVRSEEHTSELQSRENLVCRLLLEKKKKKQ